MTSYLKLVMDLIPSFEKFELAQIPAWKICTPMPYQSWLVVRNLN